METGNGAPGSLRDFSAAVERNGDSIRVALRGELDLRTVEQADDALSHADVQSSGRLVLDLSGVTFIDSTGLRFVLRLDRRARESGPSLELVPGPPEVQRVFALTRLEERLPFVGT
jgi:anti-sigma B factor antagonist